MIALKAVLVSAGPERSEPFETGSRLLYVVLTRAHHETIVLLLCELAIFGR